MTPGRVGRPPSVGARCEVWSRTMGRWVKGRVLGLGECDGAVRVEYQAGPGLRGEKDVDWGNAEQFREVAAPAPAAATTPRPTATDATEALSQKQEPLHGDIGTATAGSGGTQAEDGDASPAATAAEVPTMTVRGRRLNRCRGVVECFDSRRGRYCIRLGPAAGRVRRLARLSQTRSGAAVARAARALDVENSCSVNW